jgi:Putative zinc-finger
VSPHESERLSAYLDGELAPAERAAVETHLGTCAPCRARLAELGGLDEAARALPLPAAPPGYFESFPARVRARLEAKGRAPGPSRGRFAAAPPWRWPAWTWAVAAALFLAVVTPLTLFEGPGGRRVPPPPAPAVTAPRRGAPPEPAPLVAPPAREKVASGEPREAPLAPPPARARPPAPLAPRGAAPAEARSGEAKSADAMTAVRPATAAKAGAAATPMAKGPAAAPLERRGPQAAVEGFAEEGGEVESAYWRLAREEPTDAEGWRRAREAWRAFARAHPESPRADEARVRTIEAGMAAWRLSREEQDLDRAREDLAAYLGRPDARQADRARRALEPSERP